MSKTNNNSSTQKKTEDFYIQLYFDYVTGDETVTLISRTLGINGVSFWIWLNTTMAKYNDGLFLPSNLDALLYAKEDKDIALNYVQKFKDLNILWETPDGFFTTTFLRDNAFKRIPGYRRKQLSGSIRTTGKTEEQIAEEKSKIEEEVAAYFETAKKAYDRRYPIIKTSCYMDAMYEDTQNITNNLPIASVPENDAVKAEEDLKSMIHDVVINGGSAMDVVNSIVTPSVEPTYELKTVQDDTEIKSSDDSFPTAQELFSEPVKVLPEDYKLLDDETPTEITFDEEPSQPNIWQAPSIPADVQAKIDEHSPKATTEDTDSEVVAKLKLWGLYQNQINSLVNKTTPETLKAYIKMAEKEGRNKGAYIATAINNNWDCSRYMEHDSSSESKQPVQKEVVNDVPKTTYVDPNPNPNAYQVGDNDFADKTEVNEFISMMTGFGFNDAEIKNIVDSNTYDVARDYAYHVFTTFSEPEDKKGFYTDCITKKLEVKHWDRRPIQYKDDVVSSSGARPTDEDTIYRQKWDMAVESVVKQFIFSDELKNRWKSAWVAFKQAKKAVGASRWAEMVLHLIVSKSTNLMNYFGSQPKTLESNIDFLFTRPDLAEGIYNQLEEI